MFGLIDTWYASRKRRTGYVEPMIDRTPEVFTFDSSKNLTLCFVPRLVSKKSFMARRLIPRGGTVYVYTISSFDLITRDPEETLTKVGNVCEHALGKMRVALQWGCSIALLGVSLGNVHAIWLARESGVRIRRIVAIVGGGHLGLCGWDSILTGEIAKGTGCRSAEEYEKRLSAYSPIHHIGHIEAEEVVIRLGKRDRMISFKHGKVFADAFVKRGSETAMRVDYRAYRFADHGSTMILSAMEKLGRQ